jgi:ABC-type multidrug transport system fused ATPase/permease subunit
MTVYTTKKFFQQIFTFFRPFRKYFVINFGIMLCAQLIGAATPYLFGKSVDAVASGNIKLTAIFIGLAFLISFFQSNVMSWIKDKNEVSKLDTHIEKAFSVSSLEKMLRFSIGQHINEHSGVKQSIVTRGQNALSQLMYNMVYGIFPGSIQVFATLIILYFFDWRVAFSATLFSALFIFVSLNRNKEYFPKVDTMRKNNQAQTKLQSELYRNATLVISEAQENTTLADFQNKWDQTTGYTTNTWMEYLKTFYTHKILIIVGQYVSLSLGVYLIFLGKHSAGMFVALFSWLNAIFGNLIQIMNTQRQIMFQIVEIKKFFELLAIVPDIDSNENGKIIEPFRGEIVFRNVSFAYPYRTSKIEQEDEKNVTGKLEGHAVTNVSLTINAGSKVGFVGISGAGKSTIVNLLRRYYDPTEGEILIDGIPLREINLVWLRSKIGNVEQKIELFDRSIRDNILFGIQDPTTISEDVLLKAIKDASLEDFINKLKDNGIDTVIGEGGIKVSGGERQRIGIARALIKNPQILIFDEATSALDSINEKLIHEAINRGAKGRTTIIIAHRLSTVMDADCIFVVDSGRIVAQGTHEELIKSSKEYQNLIKNQILMS